MSLLANLSRRIYRGLTRLYPPEFREEWGGELLTLFDDCLETERAKGGAWLWRLWVPILADLAVSIPRERRDARFAPHSTRRNVPETPWALSRRIFVTRGARCGEAPASPPSCSPHSRSALAPTP